jgi:hypothetical protein
MENNGKSDESWVMPHVEPGQIVLWNFNPSERRLLPSTGVVLKVGNGTINLALHTTDTRDHVFKTGARHRDDPWLLKNASHDGGVWQLTPRDERINRMLATFESPKIAGRIIPAAIEE